MPRCRHRWQPRWFCAWDLRGETFAWRKIIAAMAAWKDSRKSNACCAKNARPSTSGPHEGPPISLARDFF